jgi:hypothetical protein
MKIRPVAWSSVLLVSGGIASFGIKTIMAAGIPDANPLYHSGTLTDNGVPVDGTRTIAVKFRPDRGGRRGSAVPHA